MIVDSHTHIWSTDPARHPWMPMNGVPVPEEGAPVERLLDELDAIDAAAAVCIQPRVYGRDHRYLLGAIAAHPDRLAGVCLVDPDNPAAAGDLRALTAAGQVRGVRFVTLTLADPECLVASSMDPVWRAIHECGLVVSLLIEPWQVGVVEMAARRHPDVDLVVDHLARARAETAPDHIDRLIGLARLPRVHVKVSALGLASRGPWPYEDMRSLVERTLAAFGASRLLWGSDFPHVLAAGPYPASLAAVSALLPGLRDNERGMICGGNAAQLYRFEP